MNTHEQDATPADIVPVESRLNALAERDRRAAPDSLEDRLFLATRAPLRAAAEPPAPMRMPAPPAWRAPLRLAAAIAVVAGAGLLAVSYFKSAPTVAVGTQTTDSVDVDAVQADLDDFLASLDSASAGDDSIMTLRSDIASTEEGLEAFWSVDSLDLDLSEDSL